MKKDTEKTKVIFKKFRKEGDIIAFFPEMVASLTPCDCLTYMHVGQHGAGSTMLTNVVPAKPSEYAYLKAELEEMGYNLDIKKKFTRKDFETRQKQLKN